MRAVSLFSPHFQPQHVTHSSLFLGMRSLQLNPGPPIRGKKPSKFLLGETMLPKELQPNSNSFKWEKCSRRLILTVSILLSIACYSSISVVSLPYGFSLRDHLPIIICLNGPKRLHNLFNRLHSCYIEAVC